MLYRKGPCKQFSEDLTFGGSVAALADPSFGTRPRDRGLEEKILMRD